jgi:cyclin-dependent kinase 8/11
MWPGVVHMPEWKTYLSQGPYPFSTPLPTWFSTRNGTANGYDLLCKLFEWDPARRITARETLSHPWFQEDGGCAAASVFEGSSIPYPSRRVTHDDNGDAKMGSWVRATLRASADTRLPPSLAGARLPGSSNFRPATGALPNAKRTKLR